MAITHALHSMQVYRNLLANPVATLQANYLKVRQLPAVNCATVRNLWFAAYGTDITIDQNSLNAAMAVMGPNDCPVQRSMVISPMRGNGAPPGIGVGGRHRTTGILNAAGTSANLWVTELQTGCTVLIVDWGGNQYSVTHLQPSQDQQFNQLGQTLMWTSNFTRNAYKNTWLKQEMTSVIQNTGGAPQRYIMIQSMFEASYGTETQVIGIRNGGQFQFYRQRDDGINRVVEHLQWSTWRAYVPYFSY